MKWDTRNGSYFELWTNTFSPIGLISSMDSRALCLVIAKVRVRFLVKPGFFPDNNGKQWITIVYKNESGKTFRAAPTLPVHSTAKIMFTLILIQFDIDILNQLLRQQNSVVKEYFRGVNRAFFGSLPTQIPFRVNIIAKSTLQTIHLSAHNLIFFIENYAFLWEHLTQLDFF